MILFKITIHIMAKTTFPILAIILLLTSFSSENKPTDLREYGFMGKVKSITSIKYADLPIKNGVWEINKDKVISKSKMIFNEKGNIIEVKQYYPLTGSTWNEMTTKVEFKNGLKSKYTKTDLYGQPMEVGTYTWIDNHNYKLTITQTNGTTTNSHSKLNKNLRDISGDYSYIQNGSIIFSEKYKNQLTPNGEIVSSTFINQENESYTIEYLNKEKDITGNLIKVALVFKETNLLKHLIIREFEYYE